jgi:hypothetical protein
VGRDKNKPQVHNFEGFELCLELDAQIFGATTVFLRLRGCVVLRIYNETSLATPVGWTNRRLNGLVYLVIAGGAGTKHNLRVCNDLGNNGCGGGDGRLASPCGCWI